MKEKECEVCGDTVAIGENGETVQRGETPIEHLERTGHAHIIEPVPTGCHHCGNLWMYSGHRELATCPNCRGKTPAGTMDEEYPE